MSHNAPEETFVMAAYLVPCSSHSANRLGTPLGVASLQNFTRARSARNSRLPDWRRGLAATLASKEISMSDRTSVSPMTASASARPGKLTKIAVALALGLGLAGIGAFATTSFSQGFGPPFGHGYWHGFWHGGPFGGGFDPARAEERADRMIRHISVEVDATSEQQEKLRGIVKNAVKDMLPMREKIVAARQPARDLLFGQSVDRAAIEKLRTEQIGTVDALSKRFTQALTDAAEVLTPEQRRKLEGLLPPAGGWRGWWRGYMAP